MSYTPYSYPPPAVYPPPVYTIEQTYGYSHPPPYYPPPQSIYITEEMFRPQTTVIEVQVPRRKKRRGCTIL